MLANNTTLQPGTTYLKQDAILYNEARDDGMQIGVLRNGDHITVGRVVKHDGKQWVKVKTNDGRNGFILGNMQLFTVRFAQLEQPEVNVYEGPSEDSRVLATFKKGWKFSLTDIENNWIKIQSESNLTGFIPTQTQIKVAEYVTKASAKKNMLVGALWCIGGTVATIIGFSAASGGGTYLVFWGAIIFGAIQFFTGLVQLLKK
jgi:hypothetical protein